MKRTILLAIVACFPLLVQAADIPTDQMQAQQYSKASCIQKATDDCVNTMCLNSSMRDCQDQCRKNAEAKCNVASE